MNTTFYAALVFGAGACYGVLSTCVKLAYNHGFGLADVSGAQYFYGMALLWIAILCKARYSISLKMLLPFFFLSIPMALTTIFYYESLETLSASLAVVFLFQSIWMGSVVDMIRKRTWPTGLHCLSVLMALGGHHVGSRVMFHARNVLFSNRYAVGPFGRLFLHHRNCRTQYIWQKCTALMEKCHHGDHGSALYLFPFATGFLGIHVSLPRFSSFWHRTGTFRCGLAASVALHWHAPYFSRPGQSPGRF